MPSHHVIFIVYMSLLSIFGTVLNLAILLVYKNRTSSNASVFLLWSLALVDLLISACVIPMTIFSSTEHFYINDVFYCGLIYFMRYFCSSMSCVLLGLIALERYKTISAKTMTRLRFLQKSLVYNTKRAIVVAVVLCFVTAVWCFVFYQPSQSLKACVPKMQILIFSTTLSFETYSIFCIVVLTFIMMGMIVLYIKSYLVVKQATNRIFIKNLDSYQPKRSLLLNFLVRFTNSEKSTENKCETDLTQISDEPTGKVDNEPVPKSVFDFRYNYFMTTNSCILSESYSADLPKSCSYESFRTESKINTISESVDQKQTAIKINEIVKDNLRFKAQNYVFREQKPAKNVARLFMVNGEANQAVNQKVVDLDEMAQEQPYIFRKRMSNFSVWNSFLRKDWKVAKMFFLVTVIFVLSWIPWVLSTLEIIQYNIFWSNLYMLNNIINPIIYSFLSKSFRKDFFVLAKTLKKMNKYNFEKL
ncbi:cholecystokinin receptor-like [Brachionus plicatilis]|uniref:Cholecystokinin receptor-like n=1 Tax=Brachionus plicatilis TaxID=10195 RepID=A0A3M7Q678_BRAPC|nr:cholecystokinin receptor-like [Brachionus plicatilis]